MTKLRTLGAAMILSAAIAAPAIARTAHHDRANYRGAYNQMIEPPHVAPPTQAQRSLENFGFRGRDP